MKSFVLASMLLFSGMLTANAHASVQVPFIFGGEDVTAEDPLAHSVISILDAGVFSCSATIISEHIALTAAHCITSNDLSLSFGLIATSSSNPRITVVEAKQNENYNSGNVDNDDVALVYFSEALPTGYTPIAVLNDEKMFTKENKVTLTGFGVNSSGQWGEAGTLRKTTVNVQNLAFGQREFSVDQTRGTGACYGDSGGPALIQVNSKYYQVGVTSRTTGNDCASEVVYSSAQHQTEWIAKTSAELIKRHPTRH